MATSNGNTGAPKLDVYKAITDLPEWMTKDYIEQALRDSEKDQSLKVSWVITLIFIYKMDSYLVSDSDKAPFSAVGTSHRCRNQTWW